MPAARVARWRRVAATSLCLLELWSTAAWGDELRDADRALAAGRLEDAMRHYELAARNGYARGHSGIGRVWLRRGRYGQAKEAFRRAIEVDASLAESHWGLGEALRREGDCAEAMPHLERAAKLDRKFPEAQLSLGNCLVATGRVQQGIEELGRGLRLGRTWAPRFLVARGTAWMALDSLRNAGIDFTRARELAPNDPFVRRAIGEFYLQRGTWALAIPELRAAIALDSTDADTRHSLAQALAYTGDYEEALAIYRQLVTREPDFAPGQLGLGDILYRAGAADPRRYAEARAPLEEYVRLEPGDSKGWSLLGRTLYRLGERDSALARMVEAERLGDRSKDLFTTMGLAYADRKDWTRALAAFERGEPTPREYPIVAQIYDLTGHPERADSVYRLMLARDSTSRTAAFAFDQRGKLRYREKDFAQAESLLGRAIDLDSTAAESWFYRGLALRELDRDAEALAALRRATALDSSKAERFFWLGVLADAHKDLAGATRAFERSVAIDSTGGLAGKAFRQLGYYQLLRRRWTTAIPLLERATALDPGDDQAWLWLAQANQNAGRRTRAAESYRRVLAIDPGNETARKGLRSLGVSATGSPGLERSPSLTEKE